MATLSTLVVNLVGNTENFQKSMSGAQKTSDGLKSKLGMLASVGGKLLLAGAATGAAAFAGAVIGGVKAVSDWAEQLDAIGDVLGTTSQESAALAVAIKGVGGNVEGITSQMSFMTRGLTDAEGKMGTTGQVLTNLGIAFQDANGQILPATDILTAVADKLAIMPDGLEKTALMTDLFGKSGKDLSDVMSALADGGLAAADEKARALGLSLSEGTTNSAIQLNRQMETLKMGLQGVFVSIGAGLLPILEPLVAKMTAFAVDVMPQVQASIASVTTWIQDHLVPAAQALLAGLQPVIDFIIANWQPIVAGMVAAIITAVIPGFVAWATAAWATATATITALAPVLIPIAAIGAAVALLYAAWQNDWGGIRTTLTAIWEGSLKPALLDLKTWLDTHLTAALQVLSDYWNNVLHPALIKVYDWWMTNLQPFMVTVKEFLEVAFTLAIKAFALVWTEVLYPAIEKIYNWFNDNILPILNSVKDLIETYLGPVISTFVSGALAGLNSALSTLKGWLENVVGWFQTLIDKIDKYNETKVKKKENPNDPTLDSVTTSTPGGSMGSWTPASVYNYNLTVYSNSQTEKIIDDFGSMRAWARG